MRGSSCCLAGRPGLLERGICKKTWASSASKYCSWPADHELPHHAQGFWRAKQPLYWALQVAQARSNPTAFCSCVLCPWLAEVVICGGNGSYAASELLDLCCMLFPMLKFASVKLCALYSYCSKREAALGSRQWNCYYRCSCLSYLSGKSLLFILVLFLSRNPVLLPAQLCRLLSLFA